MRRSLKLAIITILGLVIVGCSATSNTTKPSIKKLSIGIQGYEFGPAVRKVIIELNTPVKSADGAKVTVQTAKVDRTVDNVYLSDKLGKETTKKSKYVTLDLHVDYSDKTFSAVASPFHYNTETFMNEWASHYNVIVKGLKIGDSILSKNTDAIKNRVIPEVDKFNVKDKFTGTYKNSLTNKKEKSTLHYAAYQPEKLKGQDKNPLIIWLNGQGEGGTDTSIELLGNEVTALIGDDIQRQFSAGKQKGAYVLAVQSPTYWMDEGDGTNGSGAGVSRYTEILMDTIKEYVKPNPDIDPNRIYLSGCSNGGYMTMNMAIHYPDYFVALAPSATAYSYYDLERNEDGTYKKVKDEQTGQEVPVQREELWFDREKVNAIKDIPIWFIHAANDTTVNPQTYSLPIYKALIDAGATNKWFSYYESVSGTDIKGVDYLGHWSWIYYFNNQVTGVQDPETIRNGQEISGFEPSDSTFGGRNKAEVDGQIYDNIFSWLNAQSKN
ncbi:prolyl oligopeptidase family serine peptidase [Streptococcus dentasini]